MTRGGDTPVVVIVGAGPAGIRAAAALAHHGLRPIVVDEGAKAGGQIYRQPPEGAERPPREIYGFEAAKATRLHRRFEELRRGGRSAPSGGCR